MENEKIDSLEAASGITVLIVDDETDFLEIMNKHLCRLGLKVETAGGCRAAISSMETSPKEVVIMDVSMPEIDGIRCLQLVKELWPDTEIIILTGHASVKSGVEGMQNGAFDYCLKPIDTRELVEKIELAARKALVNRRS
ncbi:response regulator [Desulforhopalus singaporensis]|uniref:Response regulator receiver domain-containing protein n=1 Tax=Desulforhopalus singaporensis TaxID=91360 RepID=A0A1H0KHN4_9BACT|nr:response regulator [Desulforhopalus singaporensis]SDO55271.1 Response regulator receiver domain-containing protein [Desulforhopalus singaporensis]